MFDRSLRIFFFLAFLPLAACASAQGDPARLKEAADMTRLGDTMLARGEYGTAMDYYRRALAIDEAKADALCGLGEALEQFGDRQTALEVLARGTELAPQDGALRRAYGKLLLTLDRPVEAKVQYEAALALDDADYKARAGLAVALDYLGRHKEAQKEYAKLLRKDPRNLAVVNNYAYSLILSQRYARAIELLEPEVDNPAANPALRQNLAMAYGLAGQESEAARIAALDLPPAKVAESLDYYRRQRAEIRVTTAPYAELGSYATEAMAVAQAQKMQAKLGEKNGNLKPVVLPELSAPGGTPRFTVRMMGCGKPDEVSRLCETLAKSGLPCAARGVGEE